MQRWPYQVLGLTCRLTSITYLVAPNQFSCERAREGERKRENTPPENFAKMSKEIKNNKKLPLSHDTRPDDEVDAIGRGSGTTEHNSAVRARPTTTTIRVKGILAKIFCVSHHQQRRRRPPISSLTFMARRGLALAHHQNEGRDEVDCDVVVVIGLEARF